MFRRAQVVLGLAALVGVALASASAGQGPPGGSPPGLDKAIAAKEKHARRMLDKPGVVGIGVGLNPAGKPVIEIYKEKPDVADVPDDARRRPGRVASRPGVIEPRRCRPTASRDPCRSASRRAWPSSPPGRSVRASPTARTSTRSRTTTSSPGVNTASIGDPIIQPGPIEDGGSDPGDRIGTLADYQTIDFNGGTNTMDAAIALTSTGERRDRDARRRLRSAEPDHGAGVHRAGGAEVRTHDRAPARRRRRDATSSVDVCYIALVDFCLAGGAVRQPDLRSRRARSARRATPARSSSRRAATSRSALLFAGGDGLTIGNPIDPVLQRFGVTIDGAPPPPRPARRPHRPLARSPATRSVASPGRAPSLRRWLAGLQLQGPRHRYDRNRRGRRQHCRGGRSRTASRWAFECGSNAGSRLLRARRRAADADGR